MLRWKVKLGENSPGSLLCIATVLEAASKRHGVAKFTLPEWAGTVLSRRKLGGTFDVGTYADEEARIELKLAPQPPPKIHAVLEYGMQLEWMLGLPIMDLITKPLILELTNKELDRVRPGLIKKVGSCSSRVLVIDATPIPNSIVSQKFWERAVGIMTENYSVVNIGTCEIEGAHNMVTNEEKVAACHVYRKSPHLLTESPIAMLPWSLGADDVIQITSADPENNHRWRYGGQIDRLFPNSPKILSWVEEEYG